MPKNCTADMKAIIKAIDDTLRLPETQAAVELRLLFHIFWYESTRPGRSYSRAKGQSNISQLITPSDIGVIIADAMVRKFQGTDYERSTGIFCDALESFQHEGLDLTASSASVRVDSALFNVGGGKPTAGGIVATYGIDTALLALIYAMKQSRSTEMTLTHRSHPVNGPWLAYPSNGHSWNYLVCSEMGWFWISNPTDPRNLISNTLSLESHERRVCKAYFPFPELPEFPNISATLQYGGWDMQPSNVYFGQGKIDPWRDFTPLSETRSPQRKVTNKIPRCGEAPPKSEVFGAIYKGATHVKDFQVYYASHPAAKAAYKVGIQIFTSALEQWLPCFETR